jgi:hypothetical protein
VEDVQRRPRELHARDAILDGVAYVPVVHIELLAEDSRRSHLLLALNARRETRAG